MGQREARKKGLSSSWLTYFQQILEKFFIQEFHFPNTKVNTHTKNTVKKMVGVEQNH